MHLLYQEHVKMYSGLCTQMSKTAIANSIGRAPSTVTREVARNSDHIGYLWPKMAYDRQKMKRTAPHETKIDKHKNLKKYIIDKLKCGWSPKAVEGRLKIENASVRVCHESIYTWLYLEGNEEFFGSR